MSERINDIELKPCPFCGEEVSLFYDCYDSFTGYFYWIACPECGCRQAQSIHKEAVIKAWNERRTKDKTVFDKIGDELRKYCNPETCDGMCCSDCDFPAAIRIVDRIEKEMSENKED